MHEATLDTATHRATTMIAIFPPRHVITPTGTGNWLLRHSAPTDQPLPSIWRVDIPKASRADPKPTVWMPSMPHRAAKCFRAEGLLMRVRPHASHSAQ
jgi:hypothetical protein